MVDAWLKEADKSEIKQYILIVRLDPFSSPAFLFSPSPSSSRLLLSFGVVIPTAGGEALSSHRAGGRRVLVPLVRVWPGPAFTLPQTSSQFYFSGSASNPTSLHSITANPLDSGRPFASHTLPDAVSQFHVSNLTSASDRSVTAKAYF